LKCAVTAEPSNAGQYFDICAVTGDLVLVEEQAGPAEDRSFAQETGIFGGTSICEHKDCH